MGLKTDLHLYVRTDWPLRITSYVVDGRTKSSSLFDCQSGHILCVDALNITLFVFLHMCNIGRSVDTHKWRSVFLKLRHFNA